MPNSFANIVNVLRSKLTGKLRGGSYPGSSADIIMTALPALGLGMTESVEERRKAGTPGRAPGGVGDLQGGRSDSHSSLGYQPTGGMTSPLHFPCPCS